MEYNVTGSTEIPHTQWPTRATRINVFNAMFFFVSMESNESPIFVKTGTMRLRVFECDFERCKSGKNGGTISCDIDEGSLSMKKTIVNFCSATRNSFLCYSNKKSVHKTDDEICEIDTVSL